MGARLDLRRAGDVETSFVLRYFEEFYEEVVRQKDQVLAGSWTSAQTGLDIVPGDLDEKIAEGARDILDRLKTILDRQSLDSGQYGGEFAATYYIEAKFIMAALADEIFLNINWSGRKYWEDNLLESRLFGTHDAGDLFYKKLDAFLAIRDPLRKDIAEVYLLALGLGFQGKYRGIDDNARLRAYLDELYVFINHREPKLFEEGERLFPAAYTHTLEQGEIKTLQDVRLWLVTFMSIFLILFLVSSGVWVSSTSELRHAVERILTTSGSGG